MIKDYHDIILYILVLNPKDKRRKEVILKTFVMKTVKLYGMNWLTLKMRTETLWLKGTCCNDKVEKLSVLQEIIVKEYCMFSLCITM